MTNLSLAKLVKYLLKRLQQTSKLFAAYNLYYENAEYHVMRLAGKKFCTVTVRISVVVGARKYIVWAFFFSLAGMTNIHLNKLCFPTDSLMIVRNSEAVAWTAIQTHH